MNKPKFTLALEYFKKYKEATNEKDKQFYHSQYMNELFRVDQLYAEDEKKIKKEIDMICSMTDTEMKLMVSCLEFKLQDKIVNDLDSVKDLQTLIKKINIMIERQTPYV